MANVGDLVTRARVLLQDNNVQLRTSQENILGWYNEALLKASEIDPFLSITDITHVCAEAAEQTIPSGLRLLSVNYQIGGNALFRVSVDTLDREEPEWRNAIPVAIPFHWSLHSNVKKFWIYPVPNSSVILNCTVQTAPTQAARFSETVPVVPELESVVVDYICYRSLLADADNVDNQNLANDYLAKFEATLARHYQREAQRLGLL